MFEQSDGTFKVVYGRIESTAVEHSYPVSDWDKKYREKTKKGYEDITHLYTEDIAEAIDTASGPTQVAAIQNSMVKQLIDELQAFANKTIKENYTVSQEDVTQAQVDEAQKVIDRLVEKLRDNGTAIELNEDLLKLFRTVPRRMKNVKDHLLESGYDKAKVQKMLDDEQKLLDVMAGQVEAIKKQKELTKKNADPKEVKKTADMLDILGIECREANSKEVEIIKKMMGSEVGKFKKAFAVNNKMAETRFNKQIAGAKDKKTEMFWHGSRNENWLNILQTSLLIRPSGAVYTGSMYGDGIYAADKCKKAMGYSSLSGSYWTKGNSHKGFMAIFEFHVGNQRHIHKHTSECYSLNKAKLQKDDYDSVFAHGGADLINNEYIVYDVAQCTIRYLVEIA